MAVGIYFCIDGCAYIFCIDGCWYISVLMAVGVYFCIDGCTYIFCIDGCTYIFCIDGVWASGTSYTVAGIGLQGEVIELSWW